MLYSDTPHNKLSRGSRNSQFLQPPKHILHSSAVPSSLEGLLNNQVIESTSVLIPSYFNVIPDLAVLRSQNMLVRKSLFKVVEPGTLARKATEAESGSSDGSAHRSSMHHQSWSIHKKPAKVNRQVSICNTKHAVSKSES